MSTLWINGELVDKSAAHVSPFDHGLLYGDGVWEPLRVSSGKLLHAAEHLHQLFDAAQMLGIDIPLSPEELRGAIDATLQDNARADGYIRVIVTRGPGTLGPDPRKIAPQVLIIAEEYQPFPRELYAHGLHVATTPHPFTPGHSLARSRTLGQPYLVFAKRHALQQGCLEAIFVSDSGAVRGCTEGMLFLVAGGTVLATDEQLLDATGLAVAALAGDLGLVVDKKSTTLTDLHAAEEAFLAGTSCGVIGIVQVNRTPIGAGSEGPITRQIREAYRRLTIQ